MSDTSDRMPFIQHLEELRKRLITCAIAVAVGFVICYFFKVQILEWLMQPMLHALPHADKRFIYTAPHEAFVCYLKVSFLAGIGLATPVIIYQMWRFIAPGLYAHEKRYLFPVVFFSTAFFVGGALFGYSMVFPFAFKFFTSFANSYITPMISTSEYLSFATRLLFAFGMVFELPIIAFFLARLGLINVRLMKRQRKYAIVIVFIVAAMLTPPDVMSQMLMAGPLLLLYELSVAIVYFFGPKEKGKAKSKEIIEKEEEPESVA